MQPKWQKYYNIFVLLASRGIGSVLITSMFLIKKYFLPASEFGMLGHAFATVMVVASPLASPAIMLISRRIIQTRDLGRDRNIILGWSVLAFLAAAYSTAESAFAAQGISTTAFYISITAFVFVTVLNAQYIIWLNESDNTRRSLIFIVIFILTIPLSVAIREISGIGHQDRSFSVEALLLSIPVMIDILRRRSKERETIANLYDFSLNTYSKYFIIVLFYQGILWVDWTIGQHLLPTHIYIEWAGDRILLERILLPVLNIAQVTLLWHLLRSSTGKGQQNNESLSSQSVKNFFGVLVSAAALSILAWVFGSYYDWVHMVPFVIGYLAFGLTSIFLEFYQAKFSVKYLLITLNAVTASRIIIIGVVLNFAHTNDYALAWAITSIAILFIVFRMSYDQIKVGKP